MIPAVRAPREVASGDRLDPEMEEGVLAPVSFRKGREHTPRLSEPYVPGRHSSRFWTEAEKQVVREYYPKGGTAAVQARLPHRGLGPIYARARKLGLSSVNGGYRPRRTGAEIAALDAKIRAAWPTLSGRGAVQRFAAEIRVDCWMVSKRAAQLGLSTVHRKEPPWTQAEEELMHRVPLHDAHRCADIFREHGFARTPTAIVTRAKRLGLSRRFSGGLSARAVAEILGFDGKTVGLWCVAGELKAEKRGTQRLPQQGGDWWVIQSSDLRRFVIDNLARIDIRKVDKLGFVRLLVGEKDFAGEAGDGGGDPSAQPPCNAERPLHAREAAT